MAPIAQSMKWVVRVLSSAALIGIVVAGCSQDGGGTSMSDSGPQSTLSTATVSSATTVAPSTTITSTTTPATTTEAPSTTSSLGPLTADEAGALVAATSGPYGNWVPDTSKYDPSAPLSGVIGNTKGGTGTSPQQLFLFHLGQYLGTASSTPRFAFQITDTDGTTVTVEYLHYAPGDANCCPSESPYIVRYQWNDSTVVPLDPIPPEDQGFGQ